MGYARIVEIGKEVGKKYNIKLIVNFPKEGRIEEFEKLKNLRTSTTPIRGEAVDRYDGFGQERI